MSGKKPRVLIISQKFPPEKGGNASRIGDLAKHMSNSLELTIVAPPLSFRAGNREWSWKRKQTDTRDGNRIVRLWAWQLRESDPSLGVRLLYYFTFTAHALIWLTFHRKDFDVVVTSSPPIFTGMVAFPFRYINSLKWVLDVRDLWIDVSVELGFIENGGLLESLSNRYRGYELQLADYILVTSRGMEKELESKFSFDTPMILVPNGVDTTFFNRLEVPNEVDLIYTGNLGYAQDLETCISSLQYLKNDVTLRVVGTGDRRSDLEELTEELGLSSQVEFTGLVPRENIPKHLSQAKLGLAPLKDRESLAYAVPTKVYEYMACELPVVAMGKGQIDQLLREADAGICVSNNPETLAEAIGELLASEGRRNRYGSQGRTFAAKHFDRKSIAMRFVNEITTLHENR